jgi:hypothetical protein
MADYRGRYGVVRYPTYYVVIDKQDPDHKIVFESRSRDRIHKEADRLNREEVTHEASD